MAGTSVGSELRLDAGTTERLHSGKGPASVGNQGIKRELQVTLDESFHL